MQVLIDGDNIQWDTFVDNVKNIIEKKFGTNYIPTIFCQSHIKLSLKWWKFLPVLYGGSV
jgi:hypothetical protein